MSDGTVIVINRNGMGHGDPALTRDKLVGAFLNMLDLGVKLPAAICFSISSSSRPSESRAISRVCSPNHGAWHM